MAGLPNSLRIAKRRKLVALASASLLVCALVGVVLLSGDRGTSTYSALQVFFNGQPIHMPSLAPGQQAEVYFGRHPPARLISDYLDGPTEQISPEVLAGDQYDRMPDKLESDSRRRSSGTRLQAVMGTNTQDSKKKSPVWQSIVNGKVVRQGFASDAASQSSQSETTERDASGSSSASRDPGTLFLNPPLMSFVRNFFGTGKTSGTGSGSDQENESASTSHNVQNAARKSTASSSKPDPDARDNKVRDMIHYLSEVSDLDHLAKNMLSKSRKVRQHLKAARSNTVPSQTGSHKDKGSQPEVQIADIGKLSKILGHLETAVSQIGQTLDSRNDERELRGPSFSQHLVRRMSSAVVDKAVRELDASSPMTRSRERKVLNSMSKKLESLGENVADMRESQSVQQEKQEAFQRREAANKQAAKQKLLRAVRKQALMEARRHRANNKALSAIASEMSKLSKTMSSINTAIADVRETAMAQQERMDNEDRRRAAEQRKKAEAKAIQAKIKQRKAMQALKEKAREEAEAVPATMMDSSKMSDLSSRLSRLRQTLHGLQKARENHMQASKAVTAHLMASAQKLPRDNKLSLPYPLSTINQDANKTAQLLGERQKAVTAHKKAVELVWRAIQRLKSRLHSVQLKVMT